MSNNHFWFQSPRWALSELLRVEHFLPFSGVMTDSHHVPSSTEPNLMQFRCRGVREVLIDACCGTKRKLRSLQVQQPNCIHAQPRVESYEEAKWRMCTEKHNGCCWHTTLPVRCYSVALNIVCPLTLYNVTRTNTHSPKLIYPCKCIYIYLQNCLGGKKKSLFITEIIY